MPSGEACESRKRVTRVLIGWVDGWVGWMGGWLDERDCFVVLVVAKMWKVLPAMVRIFSEGKKSVCQLDVNSNLFRRGKGVIVC